MSVQSTLFYPKIPTVKSIHKMPLKAFLKYQISGKLIHKVGESDSSLKNRVFTSVQLSKHRSAADVGVNLHASSSAKTALGRSMWDPLRLDVMEGSAKHHWVDMERHYCFLCEEPVGTSLGVHLSDREHICLGLFLYLYAMYPRHWSAKGVAMDAKRRGGLFGKLYTNAMRGPGLTQEHLHTVADSTRRLKLFAILDQLVSPESEFATALTHTLQGNLNAALWASAERMFKVNISRIVTEMFPPMGPGVHSTLTHKCWGRSNMERMFEALNLASIMQRFDVDPPTTRTTRAYLIRILTMELHWAIESRNNSETTRLLCQKLLRLLSFELVFLQTMYYMNRVHRIVEELDFPQELQALIDIQSV